MAYLRRFLWYACKRLLFLTVLSGALVVTLYVAMNTANITILLKDGMATRAQVIMMGKEPDTLTSFFKSGFASVDTALSIGLSGNSPYDAYNVTGIDHRVTLEWMWCWPWDTTARADFVESIPKIDGRIKPALRATAEALDPKSVYPPAWKTARYRATLEREGGQWKIASIKMMEVLSP